MCGINVRTRADITYRFRFGAAPLDVRWRLRPTVSDPLSTLGLCPGAGRHWCSGLMSRRIGKTFPWGSLPVNDLGCLIMGLFTTLTSPGGRLLVGPSVRQFMMVGICNGFTAFSAFKLWTLVPARDGEYWKATGNTLISILRCVPGVWVSRRHTSR